jgi:flagellar hook-length control protein FliK
LQQVNAITQMLAGLNAMAQAGGAAGAASGLTGSGGLDFMLFLQQQVWSSGLPQLAQDTPDPAFAQALEQAGFGGLLAGGLDPQTLADSTGKAAAQANAAQSASAQTLPAGGLLQALIDELQQVLDAMTALDTAHSGQSSTAGQAGEMLTAGATGDPAASTTTASQPLTAQYPALAVLDSWQQALSRLNQSLNTELQAACKVSSTTPQLQAAGQAQPQLPWSLLGQPGLTADNPSVIAADSGAAAGQPVDIVAQDAAGFGTAPQQAPAVIRWFVEHGLLGEAAAGGTAAQATAAQPLAQPPTSGTGVAQPQPGQTVSGTVQLANGEEAQVTLSLLAQDSQPVNGGAVQTAQYAVRLDVPGDPAAAITATLTVERAAYSLPTAWPTVNGQPVALPADQAAAFADGLGTATETGASVQTGQPAVVAPEPATAQQQPTVHSRAASGNEAAASVAQDLAQAAGATQPSPASTPAPRVTHAAWRVNSNGVQVVHTAASTTADAMAAATTPAAALSQAAIEAAQPAVRKQTSPVTAQTAEADAAAAEAVVVDQASTEAQAIDEALKLDQKADSTPSAAEFTVLSRLANAATAGGHPTGQLGSTMLDGTGQFFAANQPQAQLPLHLLQFTQAADSLQPYSSLNYLDLTQRVMSEAAQAKSNGDGTYSARLNLNPPDLGQLYVNIAVRGETVALQMAVASTAPKAKLDESMSQLKQSLEEAGLKVVECKVVQVGNQGEGGSPDSQQQQHQHQPSKRAAVLEPEVIKAASQFGRAAQAASAVS